MLLWALSGPTFGFNDSWQLVINTSTTVITFLMVFLIQHTQNRDNDMLHIKLDELLRATERAHNMLMNLDQLDSHSLRELRKVYCRLSELDSPEDGEEELESRIRAARNIDDAAS
ncbi:Low affinity iron permease [compost metagenome]